MNPADPHAQKVAEMILALVAMGFVYAIVDEVNHWRRRRAERKWLKEDQAWLQLPEHWRGPRPRKPKILD